MKKRTLFLVLALCFAGAVSSFASDPNMGTWQLDAAKSNIPAGASKNNTVTYTAEGNKYKCVVEGVDGQGNPTRSEWVGKFDGKDYPVTGDSTADTRAIKKTGPNHYALTQKKDGKVVSSGTIELSKDGKSRTVKIENPGADQQPVTFVYDKQ